MPAFNDQTLLKKSMPILVLILAGFICYLFFFSGKSTEKIHNPSATYAVNNALQGEKPELFDDSSNKVLSEEDFDNTSLESTEIDRAIIDVVDGKIVLNGGLLFYFDYFLNLQGEKRMSEIASLLLSDLKSHYNADIAHQIYAIFERYLAYLSAVSGQMENISNEELLLQGITVKQWENEIRHEHFSAEEVEQLFGSYEKMLSKPTRASAMLKSHKTYQQAVIKNPENQDAIATELFGAEVAQRLRKLEQEREQWKQRIVDYSRQKESIVNSASLDDYGKKEAIKLLQERLFSEPEQRRIRSLERNQLII